MIRCQYCPKTFEDREVDGRTVPAEDYLHDHLSRRHQDMIPEPRQVPDETEVEAE
jgi:hypothetical protein